VKQFLVFPLIILCLLLQQPAAAQGQGEVVLYTSTPQAKADQLIMEFEKLHRGIKVVLFRGGTGKVVTKLLVEKQTGAPTADVVLIADELNMESLKMKGLLSTLPEHLIKGLPKGTYDKELSYVGTREMSTLLIHNSSLVSAPTSWKDLLKAGPNRIAFVNPITSGAALAHLSWMVERFGWAYYEQLSTMPTLMSGSNGEVLRMVAEGKAAYGMVLDYMAVEGVRKGQPIGFTYPAEGVLGIFQPMALLKRAANREDALVFMRFVLSPPGQQLFVSQGYHALYGSGGIPKGYPPDDSYLRHPIEAKKTVDKLPELKETFHAIFGP